MNPQPSDEETAGMRTVKPSSAAHVTQERYICRPEGQQTVAAFREGILFLLAAPFLVFGTIATIAIRTFRQR